MGAEMLLASLPAAEITEDRKQRLREIISGLADDELTTDELPEFDDDPEGIRESLFHHVELLENAGNSRDVAELRLPHSPYAMLFTGGPSWGDDPTLMFETFVILADIEPLFLQLELWAIEDAGNRPPTHQEQSALAVLKEFADDVRAAFGTGVGLTIDEKRLDWPDLAATYRRALKVLDAGGQENPREEVNP